MVLRPGRFAPLLVGFALACGGGSDQADGTNEPTGGAPTGGTPTGGTPTGGIAATGGAAVGGSPATGGRATTGGASTGGSPASGGRAPDTGGADSGGTGGAPLVCDPADYPYPFRNPCLPLEERVDNLLSLLTPEEKLQWIDENQPAVPRLEIDFFTTWTEGLHGLGWAEGGNVTATQFPQAFGLGHTWDPELLRQVGAIEGYEARVYDQLYEGQRVSLAVRAPMIDLNRDPRWGRTEESLAEDPYLLGELAKGFVRGLQGDHERYLLTASTLKHFVANNNENDRETTSSNFDDRNLHEYYLIPFREAIVNGNAQSFMTAYNLINGVPATITPLLRDLVIGQWGFDGMICTDAFAMQNLYEYQAVVGNLPEAAAAAIQAGQSVILASDRDAVAGAYEQGLVTLEQVDASLRGNLRMRFRLGEFDPPELVPYTAIAGSETPWSSPAHQATARTVAQKSIVLLKNADAMLPLDSSSIGSIAVIGPRSQSVEADLYGGIPPYAVTPLAGIEARVGSAVAVHAAVDNTNGAAVTAASTADVAVVVVGNHPLCGDVGWAICNSPYEGKEAVDRTFIELEPAQQTLVQEVVAANPRTIVVLVSSFPQAIEWIDGNVPAIVHSANSGQELGNAIADVLFGDVNPGGRLTMTWYRSTGQLPEMMDYDIRNGRTYQYFVGDPLYPFGHGLSYTTFEYGSLATGSPTLPADGEVEVRLDVANTGSQPGDEVVQLYASFPDSAVTRPQQQLVGFSRITLEPGESQTVLFALRGEQLGHWDPTSQGYVVDEGSVRLRAGSSSADIRLEGEVTVIQ